MNKPNVRKQKKIAFMNTSFRDGFQSVYGARVKTADFLPALEASVEAGMQYYEAGGGARFQSLFFYCQESAFEMMDQFRKTTGPTANLQTLARGINVVALNQQPHDIIDLHAKMFKKHGISTIRNFDALNDIRNLKYSGERITHHGLHHQIVITLMALPPGCTGSHTPEFYIERLKQILASEIPFDSICFKDSTGTTTPRNVLETIQQTRKLVSEETTLHLHTHDTAGIGVQQYMMAIEAGIDCIDLAMSPVSGGTSQPDILTMWHALKGTEYTLDIDYEKILKVQEIFTDCMKDYYVPPESKMVTPTIPLSPMPGGALTANTMMMRDTGTLHLYPKVIKEMAEVIKLGGFGTSVTPVSQFYFQQAYLNATQGRWKKINPNFGNMVLGYFGRPPVEPDSEIVKLASEQLGKPVFKEDPLDVLESQIPKTKQILQKHGLEETEENIFIVASCEDKGVDYLLGKAPLGIRKKSNEDTKPKESKSTSVTHASEPSIGPRAYHITVNGTAYDVTVNDAGDSTPTNAPIVTPANAPIANAIKITAQIPGSIAKIKVKVGEQVEKNQVVLIMEAMKMETPIQSPQGGTVDSIPVSPGQVVQTGGVLLTLH